MIHGSHFPTRPLVAVAAAAAAAAADERALFDP